MNLVSASYRAVGMICILTDGALIQQMQTATTQAAVVMFIGGSILACIGLMLIEMGVKRD